MNIFYAAMLVCWPESCMSLTDDRGPYNTYAECQSRLKVMQATAVIAFAHMPGVRMGSMCGSLDEVRRAIPGAYPGESAT